jgi:hypothetical protein
VPEQVRTGVLATIDHALNELNRSSKRIKFGYSSSEDAVTWTVFQAIGGAQCLELVVQRALGKAPHGSVKMLLWGVEQAASPVCESELRKRIIAVLSKLGESAEALSEPDVVLATDIGWLIIEAKYLSGNDYADPNDARWDLYLDSPAFREPDRIRKSRLYELARNWRLAWELGTATVRPINSLPPSTGQEKASHDRPINDLKVPAYPSSHALAILCRPTLFRRDQASLEEFEKGLNLVEGGRFLKWSWADVVSVIAHQPEWFRRYLAKRHLS